MADHTILIPFILNAETSAPFCPSAEMMFLAAVRKGQASHPLDKGGLTLCGVTLATFREYCRRKGLPTPGQRWSLTFGEWTDIYKSMFWDRCKAELIRSGKVAAAMVDWTWVSGANGIRGVQRLLGVASDGIVGPKTLHAINSFPDQDDLFSRIQQARIRYHNSIAPPGSANRTFLRGWNCRVGRLTSYLVNFQN